MSRAASDDDGDVTPPPSPTKKLKRTPSSAIEISTEAKIAIQTIRDSCVYDNNGILVKYKGTHIASQYNEAEFRRCIELVEAEESLYSILAVKYQNVSERLARHQNL
jgi:hypothetical protein